MIHSTTRVLHYTTRVEIWKWGVPVVKNDDSVQHFVEAAGFFCQLVEHHATCGLDSKRWLDEIGQLLLRLDAEIQPLNGHPVDADYSMLQDLEERFVLFHRLKSFLGALDEYWSESDLEAGDGLKTGSLADDIADLYFDLKRGLTLYRSGSETQRQAVDLWLYSYHVHWKQHLRDAKKQLFEFRRVN